jgi:hypothetical protein|uniref:Uncharacterized protein n=1 Tax=Siphoviridae sp. ctg6Y13 TaxID=2826419 RepID=A0A8S5QZ40_9CAUD|nr:MAG TPA: hypothetical protein [Siphoviridae sp. ctg6Y13]
MEVKIIIEIEEGSKPIIENLSKALKVLGNIAVLSSSARNTIGKVEKFVQTEPAEEEYVRQETGDWQTNDVKAEPEKTEETPVKNVETPKEEEPKKAETPSTETQGWSYDQLKAGCHEASTMNLGSKVAELIKGKYNLSKLTELDPKLYDAFANDLRELGVRI